ncbi:MAG TPA: hypothetical protein ENN78_00260 [Candidatus Omnitrophica bacterium]|nr:hypothetical protein [Candidatus Omnitrophota bacterium]
MNKITMSIFSLILYCFCKQSFADYNTLPLDFIDLVSEIYKVPAEFNLSAGGAETRNDKPLDRYPVIMIAGNKRSFRDWLGKNTGNAEGDTSVYKNLIETGFIPEELWLYQYTAEDKEMRNIEELTDGLKWFIYSVLWYTKSNRIQILAHGEGAVLAQATIKKYHLYNLVHTVVYINGPFHGSSRYTYTKALMGSPVCANLAIGSDFLQDIILPDETPYNVLENENNGNIGIKYITIYNNALFPNNPNSPALSGAYNYNLNWLDHDGLRCSPESSTIFIPFLSDRAVKYDILHDKDGDGFMCTKYGGIDCDDNNPSIFPGAPEIPEDNIDQNCNNMDLLFMPGKDCWVPIADN